MNQFEIELDDGTVFTVEAADEAAARQVVEQHLGEQKPHRPQGVHAQYLPEQSPSAETLQKLRNRGIAPAGSPLKEFLDQGASGYDAYSAGKASGNTLDFDDEIGAAMDAPISAAADYIQGRNKDKTLAQRYNDKRKQLDVGKRYLANKHPKSYMAGQLAGGLGLGAAKGGAALINSTNKAIAAGAGFAGAQSIGNARPGARTENLVEDMLIGGATAGIIDRVGLSLAKRSAKKAIPELSSSKSIKAEAGRLYDVMDASRVAFRGDAYRRELNTLAGKMFSKGFDRRTNSHPALNPIVDQLIEAQNYGLSIRDLERFRQSAVGVILDNPDKKDTRRLAGTIVSAIDKMVDRSGNWTAGNAAAIQSVKEARRLWRMAVKADLIEEATYKAGNAASGYQKGLENEFRKILNKRYLRESFSPQEIKTMERITNGTLTRNAVREVGKAGFKLNGNNWLGGATASAAGGAVGSLFGPVGTIAGAVLPNVAAAGARGVTTRMTQNAVNDLGRTVAGGGRMPRLLLQPYSTLPLIGATSTQIPATHQK